MTLVESYRREISIGAAGALAAMTVREALAAWLVPDGFTASVVIAFFACVVLFECFDTEGLER